MFNPVGQIVGQMNAVAQRARRHAGAGDGVRRGGRAPAGTDRLKIPPAGWAAGPSETCEAVARDDPLSVQANVETEGADNRAASPWPSLTTSRAYDVPRSAPRLSRPGVPRQRRRAPDPHPGGVSATAARLRAGARPRHDRVLRLGAPRPRRTARALLRRRARARPPGDRMVARDRVARAALPGLQRRRPRDHGGGEPRRERRRRMLDRPQHRPAARAASECVHHAGSELRVSLLLHAQALVRAPRPRHRRLSRRLRHARRAVRDPDALPDGQAASGRSWC